MLAYSLGATVLDSGTVGDVIWDSAAFNAGLAPGMKVIAVGGREYSSQRLKDAVATAANKAPIVLLVKQFDRIETMNIDYHGGLRYPVLERIAGKPDRLAELWKAR